LLVDPVVMARRVEDSKLLGPSFPDIWKRSRGVTDMLPATILHALSGMFGSLLAEALLFPLDRIKFILQTRVDQVGFLKVLVSELQSGGLATLYKGLHVSMFKEGIHSFNYWCFHGMIFNAATSFGDTSKTAPGKRLLLNLVVKQLNWLCTTPFEVVSSVNQLAPDSPGIIISAARLYRSGGLSQFYRGLLVSLVLAINPAIMNTLITTFLQLMTPKVGWAQDEDGLSKPSASAVAVATAAAKMVSTFLTYPLIRVKMLQQTSSAGLSVLAVFKFVLASEGFRGLYRGVLATSYKTILWNSVMMMFKYWLTPHSVVTPPSTTKSFIELPPMQWMMREPFPVDLVTGEKLDQIISYLQAGPQTQKRVSIIEKRLDEVSCELKEIKSLLVQVLQQAKS